ncbi:MAG: late competence development ComFB family protein [Spirochaetaceae bacterium]|nr:late competence development ComFB family protein [Spirochaetaceae bacterium]
MEFDINNYDFEFLVDEGRRLVIEELGRQLSEHEQQICVCNDCVLDMAAMALNALQPRYRCSLLGSIYQSDGVSDPKYAAQLKSVVSTAIKRVGANPGHD